MTGGAGERARWTEGGGAVAALAVVLVVTVAWWALALWPTSDAPPEWLLRARLACFNAGADGMPDASGWLLLVGQPLGMIAVLVTVWGRALRSGLASLAGVGWGRGLLAGTVVFLGIASLAAGARVVQATAAQEVALPADELPPDTYPRLDREAPPLGLVDQAGGRVGLDSLAGRPALVTFAFAHCETVCPAVVQRALEAQRRQQERHLAGELAGGSVPRLVVVTLDPWRDTPSRLPHMAEHWKIGDDGFVLSGPVDEVVAVLDAWNVAHRRDTRTGDVVHAPLTYLLDGSGRIAYATTGGTEAMLELLARL